MCEIHDAGSIGLIGLDRLDPAVIHREFLEVGEDAQEPTAATNQDNKLAIPQGISDTPFGPPKNSGPTNIYTHVHNLPSVAYAAMMLLEGRRLLNT